MADQLPPQRGAEPHLKLETVTIASVDRAIRDWFDKTVAAHVVDSNGKQKKVPIILSSGERFVTSRERRGIRDQNGVLILPLISLRRTSNEPNPDMQALGTETATLTFARRLDGKTSDLMDLNEARSPTNRVRKPVVHEVFTIPFPDRSVMNYELVVQASYTGHVNAIIEKIRHELDIQNSFVAPFENDGRHPQIGIPFDDRVPSGKPYVVGFLDNETRDDGNLDEFTDQERIVRWTTSITVPATLVLDPEGERPAVRVERTAYKVAFGAEEAGFVDDPAALALIFGPPRRRR